MIDKAKLKKEMDAMVEMLTHPEFVAAMKNMKETPISRRRDVGRETLTINALRKKGVPIPAGMRLTTRYFEPGRPEVIEVDPDGILKMTVKPNFLLDRVNLPVDPTIPLDPLGNVFWGGCACGGTAIACGGAGGGT